MIEKLKDLPSRVDFVALELELQDILQEQRDKINELIEFVNKMNGKVQWLEKHHDITIKTVEELIDKVEEI